MAAELARPVPVGAAKPACTVIVPVFNGFAALARCLESLERHTAATHRIVLVDDASTDARVAPLLAAFAARRANCAILGNPRNLGFVGAANRAIAESAGDVVILNSDTEVTAGWLEALLRCRASDRAIGIVCPLSNRATILSIVGVPELYARADGSHDVDAIAECVRLAADRSYPRLPTAVGFCMLVTREALDTIGQFDAAYGRGYGEENDLSLRAIDAGFEIACCDDAYVHHAGEASFGEVSGIEADRERNRLRLERRWPMYSRGVKGWSRANPLRPAIERANARAERERLVGRPRVLQVIHRFESRGGVEEHTRALINELKNDVAFTVTLPQPTQGAWADFVVERPLSHVRIARLNFELAQLGIHVIGHPANTADAVVEGAFRDLLQGGFDVVHFQSLVGWNTLRLPRIARDSGARVVLSAHDLSLLCADYNMMTGREDRPCGRDAAHGSDAGCVACLRTKSEAIVAGTMPPSIAAYLDQRFEAATEAVGAADAIVCPSEYVASRMRRAFGEACAESLRVIGHGVIDYPIIFSGADRPMLRVAFLGRFSDRKGGDLALAVAQRLAGQRIVFEIWGPVEERLDAPARAAGMLVRGLYEPGQLATALRGIDLAIMPSLMEESFCLVVSEAQRLGIPVAASSVGAIPERVHEGETGFLFPPGDVNALAVLLLRLRDDRSALARVAARLREERPKTMAANAVEYLALYRELAGIAPRAIAAIAASGATSSAELTRRMLGMPRIRENTRLGDDDYDRWLSREVSAAPSAMRPPLDVIVLPEDDDVRALNRTIADAASRWVVVTEAGDTLAPCAIEAFAQAASENPRAALIYCDEDAISARGERYDPSFKPGFSPELLRHRPYIAGLCALDRDRVLEMGGLRASGWMGVVDFALRLAETQDPRAVAAVRGLLVHRDDRNLRKLDDAQNLQQHRQLVTDHLRRMGVKPAFLPAVAGAVGLWAHAPASTDPVAVFIRAVEGPKRAAACFEALAQRLRQRVAELFVDLDEAGSREVANALASRGMSIRITPALQPGGSPLAFALRHSQAPWLLVVDGRCEQFSRGFLERLEQGLTGRFAAGIAPQLAAADGGIIAGWEILGAGPWAVAGAPPSLREASALADMYGAPREVSCLSPRLALIRRDAAFASGALDDMAGSGRFDMAHLCLALGNAGFDLLSRPFVAAEFKGPIGVEAASRTSVSAARVPPEVEWMRRRWGEKLEDDPHFHPALRLGGERLAPEVGFFDRVAGAPARPRICAFPFDRWGSGELRVRQPLAALAREKLADILVMSEHDSGRAPNRLEMRRLAPDAIYALNFFHDYQLLALEDYARHSKALRVLGMDDLLTELPPENPYAATIYPDIADRIARAASLCDRLIVSTASLAEAYGRHVKDVRIIPNGIDERRWAGLANRPRGGPRARVGWAGAKQHLGDLRLIEPVVKATCREIDWVFFGLCPPAIRPLVAEMHEMVPIAEYPAKLASLGLDLAVAPLQDIAFNRAKSNLKLLEYGILRIPVVASSVTPYRNSPATLVGDAAQDWIDAVRSLAGNRDAAREAGDGMHDYVLTNGLLSRMLADWSLALDPAR